MEPHGPFQTSIESDNTMVGFALLAIWQRIDVM
jgi:hypothetical protein